MEVSGLVVGIAGLAGLFSTCLEGFSLIQSIRCHGRDYEILQTKLDLEKTRILQWGDAVGILSENSKDRSHMLDLPQNRPTIERMLNCIAMILTDTDELKSKYGIRDDRQESDFNNSQTAIVSISTSRLNAFRTRYARFQSSITSQQKRAGILTKAKWAIRDHEAFDKLIKDLQDFVDGLYKVVPVAAQFARLLVKEDIDSLPANLGTLRLVTEACAGRDDEWSDTASARLQDTECATESARDIMINEWRRNVEDESRPEEDLTLRGQVLRRAGITFALRDLDYEAEYPHHHPWIQGSFSPSNCGVKLYRTRSFLKGWYSSSTNFDLPNNMVEINHIITQGQLPPVSVEELNSFRQMVQTGTEIHLTQWLVNMTMISNDFIERELLLRSRVPLINGFPSYPKPDVCFGAKPEQLDNSILNTLRTYIGIERNKSIIVPNCFLEVRRHSEDNARQQAYYSGLAGARGVISLQLYLSPQPVLDENAYTLTMTFNDGKLRIYTIWAINSSSTSQDEIRFQFRIALVGEWAMSDSLDSYQQGRAALWNASRLAQDWRSKLIDTVNARQEGIAFIISNSDAETVESEDDSKTTEDEGNLVDLGIQL